jgi:hypothetical protein
MLTVVENAARDEMKNIFLIAYDNGMTRVGATLKAYYHVRLFSKEVDNLALTLIAPLGTNQYGIHSSVFLNDDIFVKKP